MKAALEYNEKGCLLWSLDCPGAFGRGVDREGARAGLVRDTAAFCRWAGWPLPAGDVTVAEEKYQPELHVEDADSDILFAGEHLPMAAEEYAVLKALVLRSARDMDTLFASVPDPDLPLAPPRATFYGDYPNTARRMYDHTNSVTAYYVGEIGGEYLNDGGCYVNRLAGLAVVEELPGFLTAPAREGSWGEWWSLRKVMRRFLWHDRIHARAMYRRAKAVWGEGIADPFLFE